MRGLYKKSISITLINAHVSAPYSIAGLTIVLCTFPLTLGFILLSHNTLVMFLQFFQLLCILCDISASYSPSSDTVDPRYLNLSYLFKASPCNLTSKSPSSQNFMYSAFFLLILKPLTSKALLQFSAVCSASSRLVLHRTISSANNMHHGASYFTPSPNTSTI